MKTIYIVLIITLAGIIYSSCDKIDSPYRQTVVVDTTTVDTVPVQRVLVEDYTGHFCGNCPYAGVFLNDTLKPLYGNRLIVITVHAGFWAGVNPGCAACGGGEPAGSFRTNFNTTVGTAWYNFFQVISAGNPIGMINRKGFPTSTHLETFGGWAPAVSTSLNDSIRASVKITNTFTAPNTVSVQVDSKFLENLSGDYNLQVVITEDSLVDWQVWYPPVTPKFDSDYLHRYVLRDALNSPWGDVLVTGSVTSGTSFTKNYNYTINSLWNVDNCNIVAFIYDKNTYEIINVQQASVK